MKHLKKLELKSIIIEDSLYVSHQTSTVRTNLKINPIDPSKQRLSIKSIILTPDNLIVRNTYLTCYFKINVDLMTSYEITKKMIGTEIKLNIIDDQNVVYFIFRTKKVDKWIEAFDKVNISEEKVEFRGQFT